MMKKLLCSIILAVLTIGVLQAQSINVTGLGNVIAGDGSNTPSVTDDTDFGSLDVNGASDTHTFTINNTTGADIVLLGINPLSGANASDFSFTDVVNPLLVAGESTTFTVTFDPNSPAGLKSAVVSIDVNNLSTGAETYTFNIQGTATEAAFPEIDLSGNGISIANNDLTPSTADDTDFGPVDVTSGSVTNTFTISNLGNAPLNLTNAALIIVSGGGGDFTVTNLPSTPIAPLSTTTFDITFNPSTTGTITANILIQNDDSDESNYLFRVQGEGTIAVPDIDVSGNGVSIISPDLTPSTVDDTDFGSVDVTSGSVTNTFTITNTGGAPLNLTNASLVVISGGGGDFTVTNLPTTPIPAAGSTTFDITFDPSTTGTIIANVVIPNDDPDSSESNFLFRIQGEGTNVANEPEMDVLGNGTEITSGDTTPSTVDNTDFGQVDVSTGSVSQTFTIENNGTNDLLLTDPTPFVTITGANASDFTLSARPTSTIASGNSTTFIIEFDPSAVGVRTATVSIANNDADENPYTFAIQGEGIDNNAGAPLLITQYYENGNEDYIEIKNISANTVPQQFFLCLYDSDLVLSSISNTAPDQSIQIPTLAAGQVVVFRNPAASGSGTTTPAAVFSGRDVIFISATNDTGCYAGRIDAMGVIGSSSGTDWGSNVSYIKGCGTNESPSQDFAYDAGATPSVTDYITLTTAEVDAAASNTNLFLGTQTIGPTTYTSSWNNGIPDKTKNAIVNGTYAAGAGSFESCNLTIGAAGSLDFGGSTSDFIKVYQDLAINGNFILGDNAALITVDENATITGAITKQESSTTLNNSFDFTYWSSPVQGASTSVFTSTGAPADRIFEWRRPLTNGTGDYGGWELKSGSLEQARGYISEAPDGSTQHNINFTGTPYNGEVDIFVNVDTSIPDGGGGFNLVGNPYPSAISADDFLTHGPNSEIQGGPLNGSIWLWTHTTAYQDNEGTLNDYNVDDYATYNGSGGVAACGTCPVPNGIIGTSQGFFVNAKSAGSIFFTNEMRVDGQNTQFFRGNDTKKSNNPKDRLWLNVTSKEGGAFNQILVGFFDQATDGEDSFYDAQKFSGGNYISLYSTIESKKYAIQGLSSFSSDKRVAIGFDAWVKETFTITLNTVEGVLNNEEIYLVDNYLNIVHDLKASGYEFEITETGSFADRFTLQFNKSVLGVDEELLNNSFIVANENNTLRVRASETVTNIKVYDMLGRLLIDNDPNNSDFTLNTSSIAKGTVLVLNATLANGVEVSKKAIKF